MRGRGQVAPEQQREGRTCQAGQGQQQGGARRGPRRGQLPRDPGDGGGRVANIFLSECEIFSGVGGHTPGVVRHKPQEMAQFACGRRRRGRRGNGTAILLLNTNNNLVKRKYDLKVGLSFS